MPTGTQTLHDSSLRNAIDPSAADGREVQIIYNFSLSQWCAISLCELAGNFDNWGEFTSLDDLVNYIDQEFTTGHAPSVYILPNGNNTDQNVSDWWAVVAALDAEFIHTVGNEYFELVYNFTAGQWQVIDPEPQAVGYQNFIALADADLETVKEHWANNDVDIALDIDA